MKKYLNYKNILLLIYIIITFIITINHEPWRDEAQAWLISKNSNIIEIFKLMKYEGHPCLWHIFLIPFTKLNFPYKTINIISWIIGCISTTIILKKSPFSKYTTTSIILSIPILYYYVVLGRSYSLILLLISLLMITYPNRKTKPILYGINLALLTNTHILTSPIVGFLMLKEFYELSKDKTNLKKRVISLSIQITGVLLLIIQLTSSLSSNADVANLNTNTNIISSFFILLKTIVNSNYILFIALFYSLIGILFTIRKQKFILIATITTIIFYCFVNSYIYYLGIQHIGIILLSILLYTYIFHIESHKKKSLEIFLCTFFIVTIPFSIHLSISDIFNNFTNAKDTATYIMENIPKNTTFLCIADGKTSSLIPYLQDNYKFISHYTEKEFTYIVRTKERNDKKITFNINNIIKKHNIKYIIHTLGNNDNEINNLKQENHLKTIAIFNDESIIKSYSEEYEILEIIE